MHRVKLKGYWDGGERRSTERLNILLEVKYFENGNSSYAKSADISEKGVRLLLDEKLEENTPLRLEIKLPGQNHLIKTHSRVVWSREAPEDEKFSAKRLFNTGLKFVQFQGDDEKKLFDFIYNLQPQKR